MSSGFTSFEDARQALIFRYYHPQADFQTMIPPARDNAVLFNQNISQNQNAKIDVVNGVYTSDVARKAATFPRMDSMSDFAREYILLLAQWNQQDLFTEEQIREFVYYIEARKGRHLVSSTNAQIYNSNVTYLTQNTTSTVQPWSYGNPEFIRELTTTIFLPLKNRT